MKAHMFVYPYIWRAYIKGGDVCVKNKIIMYLYIARPYIGRRQSIGHRYCVHHRAAQSSAARSSCRARLQVLPLGEHARQASHKARCTTYCCRVAMAEPAMCSRVRLASATPTRWTNAGWYRAGQPRSASSKQGMRGLPSASRLPAWIMSRKRCAMGPRGQASYRNVRKSVCGAAATAPASATSVSTPGGDQSDEWPIWS